MGKPYQPAPLGDRRHLGHLVRPRTGGREADRRLLSLGRVVRQRGSFDLVVDPVDHRLAYLDGSNVSAGGVDRSWRHRLDHRHRPGNRQARPVDLPGVRPATPARSSLNRLRQLLARLPGVGAKLAELKSSLSSRPTSKPLGPNIALTGRFLYSKNICYSSYMAKKRKKRNKRYTGEDAKLTGVAGQNKPVIHRYDAVQRNSVNQWVYDRRKLLKTALIALGIILFVVLIVFGLIQSFNR